MYTVILNVIFKIQFSNHNCNLRVSIHNNNYSNYVLNRTKFKNTHV